MSTDGPYAQSSATGCAWPWGKPYPEPEWSEEELNGYYTAWVVGHPSWNEQPREYRFLSGGPRPYLGLGRLPWFVRLARRFTR